MAEITADFEGTLDKFMGDGVMVFLGDPKSPSIDKDAKKCVQMAIEMQKEAKKMNMGVRIGINSGMCTVGNFGSKNRMDYTIIGSTVNLAARLERSSEPGQISISDSTYQLVKDALPCTPRESITVKGIEGEIVTYWVDG